MKNKCAWCGKEFENSADWYQKNGNMCPSCISPDKIKKVNSPKLKRWQVKNHEHLLDYKREWMRDYRRRKKLST